MYNLVRVRNSAPPAGVTTSSSSPRGSTQQQAIPEKSSVLGGLKFFYKEKNSGSKVKGGTFYVPYVIRSEVCPTPCSARIWLLSY
jgi:hypothetical protein